MILQLHLYQILSKQHWGSHQFTVSIQFAFTHNLNTQNSGWSTTNVFQNGHWSFIQIQKLFAPSLLHCSKSLLGITLQSKKKGSSGVIYIHKNIINSGRWIEQIHYDLYSIAHIWVRGDKGKKKKFLKVLFVCTCLYTFQECGEWRAGDNRGLVFVGLSPAHPVD